MDHTQEKDKETMTYEEAIRRLEEIVTLLERGEPPLDQAMALFREGVALSSFCGEELRAMKEEMVKLVGADGKVEPIDAGD